MKRPVLYISHDADYDWLVALEFGRVDDCQPPDNWRGVSDHFGYLHDSPGGQEVGFKVLDFSRFEVEAKEVAELWNEPYFDAPLLGLVGVSAGEIVLATRALLGERATISREYFDEAVGEQDPEKALELWLACLEAGDSMAHFGLGYTLYELGRHQEAYRHLRHYTEIAPHGAWNWCWYGKAAAAIGQAGEAASAYERALLLEAEGDDETDAGQLLKELVGFDGMSEVRARLNEQTEGAVGLYSTAEHYSSGPSAKVLRYYQYDRGAALDCPACGWHGNGEEADTNLFDEVFDLCCPSCEKMLVIVSLPTLDETREAAGRGNQEARRELDELEGGSAPGG